jgi:hypothetical protein
MTSGKRENSGVYSEEKGLNRKGFHWRKGRLVKTNTPRDFLAQSPLLTGIRLVDLRARRIWAVRARSNGGRDRGRAVDLVLGCCDNPPRKIPYYHLKPIHFGH